MDHLLSEPWYARFFRQVSATVQRALGTLNLGADYSKGTSSRPQYDPASSMSAMAAFPWVYAAMMRASGDLAGLPLRGYQRKGTKVVELSPDHPAMRILRRPHPKWTGRQLRRQLYVDLRLTGNCFINQLGVGSASSLMRLHPRRVEISTDPNDGYGDYHYIGTGARQTIPSDQIFHVRAPSWQDDPRGLWGTGAIESLHNDLTTDNRASQATANLSKRPRPDIIVSPASDGEILSKEVRAQISKELDKMLADGGTVVMSSNIKMDLPSWSPRDLEFPALRQLVREAVLAVTGVPPHLVGLPVANYAQSQEQTLCYWELQQAIAADFEDAFLDYFGEIFGPGIFIRHDFSRVDALQAARTGRLNRVQTWWAMGFDAVEMAKYEGFEGLPENAMPAPPSPAPAPAKAISAKTAPESEDARTTMWNEWVERAHKPAEKRLSGVMSLFFRQQAARIAEKAQALEAKALQKALADNLLVVVWDDAVEKMALESAVKPHLKDILRTGWQSAASQMGLDLSWDPVRADPSINAQLGSMIVHVNGTTKAAVRQIILDGIAAGDTINELQARIQSAVAFNPARALAVARTEATRSIDSGHLVAYSQAEAAGVGVKKQWLSARDSRVRDAHMMLDGQTVPVSHEFIVPAGSDHAGAHAPGPGQFSEAALCVNCRCTTIPILEES